jgi:outer membrane receptor protein involved in Fe transport
MAKGRISVPGPTHGSFVSVEGQFLSRRMTLAGATTSAATPVNVTMIQPLGRAWELSGSVQNIFNEQYADPASSQSEPDTIPQNGRTAWIGLRWMLGAK